MTDSPLCRTLLMQCCRAKLRLLCLSSLFVASGFITGARAESTRFYCSTENAAEQVAERVVIGGETLDRVVVPMIEIGTCFWSSSMIEILVRRKGKAFKSGDEGVIVAAFMLYEKNAGHREFYALLRLQR